jgi:hypothetical protein
MNLFVKLSVTLLTHQKFFFDSASTFDIVICWHIGLTPGDFRCRECETFLCSTCEQNHMKNRKWKTHTVLKLSDIKDPSDFSYDVLCSVHTCKQLEEYCAGEDCKIAICATCCWSSACWRQQFRHLSAFDGFRYYLIFINHVSLIKKPIPLLFKDSVYVLPWMFFCIRMVFSPTGSTDSYLAVCPQCSKKYEVTDESLETFVVDFPKIYLVNFFKTFHKKDAITFDTCKGTPGDFRCRECETFLCSTCEQNHMKNRKWRMCGDWVEP